MAGTDEQRVAVWRSEMLGKYGRAFELSEAIAKDPARTGTESTVDAGVNAAPCWDLSWFETCRLVGHAEPLHASVFTLLNGSSLEAALFSSISHQLVPFGRLLPNGGFHSCFDQCHCHCLQRKGKSAL
jgi:hypothetical protein